MTLTLNQLRTDIAEMGRYRADWQQSSQQLLTEARQILQRTATDFDRLEALIGQATSIQEQVRFSWLGAAPAGEALNLQAPPPDLPAAWTIIAADGSQIHPDRHAVTLYYLINVGAIVYQAGSGQAPHTLSNGQIFYKEEELLDANTGLLINAGIVNVKRDVAEVGQLASLAGDYSNETPLAAVIDGQLSLRVIDLSAREQDYYLQQYLAQLDQLRAVDTHLAGYIDRPRSGVVLALLHLAGLETDTISESNLRHNRFIGLTDAALFANLPPGHRSALFAPLGKAQAVYAKAGHALHFFYLNTGTPNQPNIVRIEVPGWVAQNTRQLGALHAMLLAQARMTGGYPYVLDRAHELAIVSGPEREALETMLAVSLHKHGANVGKSLKQQRKDLLGNREGFRF